MKTFEHWKAQELQLTFGLKKLKKDPALEQWLKSKVEPSAFEVEFMNKVQIKLQDNADTWNEDEVKFNFIGPLVTMMDFEGDSYNSFNQRPLAATPPDQQGKPVELKGKPDLMVATGRQDPLEPYFFIHEYKPEKKRETDPLGQVLSAMVAAQANNEATHPLYGCYVIGRLWFFVLLNDKRYSVSLAYDATQEDDLYKIYSILKTCKAYIEDLIAKGKPVFPV